MANFTRRRFLASAAALPLSRFAFAGTVIESLPCTLAAEQETGPFYVADELLRREIGEGKPGVALRLTLTLLDARTCKPLPAAAIDLWHCDAVGIYSGYTAASQHMGPEGGRPPGPPPDRMPGFGGEGGPPPMRPSDKLTFCRGIQITGDDGVVRFDTILPGFYEGRTNHIHLKARVGGHAQGKTYQGGHTAHTGQIFFPEEMLVPVMATEPYRSHHIHRTTAAEDGVFQSQSGASYVAQMITSHLPACEAQITLAVDPTSVPKPVRGGPGGAGGPGGPGSHGRPPREFLN